jgi:AraC-like DNA-binding protein
MNQKTPERSVSSYKEFAPEKALRSAVLCVWEQRILGDKCEYAHRVLPDGCIDIVLINDEAPAVIGPWTEAFVARFPPETEIVAARFHPGRAAAFLGVPASELLNQSVPLRDLWQASDTARFSRIAEAKGLAAKRSALEVALFAQLGSARKQDGEVGAALHWLAQFPATRIERLSRRLGISSRHLQRRFCAAVGYGPKMFQSVLRFQRLLKLGAGKNGRASLAEISIDAGYADQQHMNREVRRFSGIVPTALLPEAGCALRMSTLIESNGETGGRLDCDD